MSNKKSNKEIIFERMGIEDPTKKVINEYVKPSPVQFKDSELIKEGATGREIQSHLNTLDPDELKRIYNKIAEDLKIVVIDDSDLSHLNSEDPESLSFDYAEALSTYRHDYNEDHPYMHFIGYILEKILQFRPAPTLTSETLDEGGKIMYSTLVQNEDRYKEMYENGLVEPIREETTTGPGAINPKYSHFAILKADNKIINGWEYNGYDTEDLKAGKKEYFLDDVVDLDYKPSEVLIITTKGMQRKGINPFDSANWHKFMAEGNLNEDSADNSEINKYVYFCYNYPPNFIDDMFGETGMADHFKGKFKDKYNQYGSRGVMNEFYIDLDNENKRIFEEWIRNNYKG